VCVCVCVWGGGGPGVLFMKDIFILNKIYIMVGTLLSLNMKTALFQILNFTKAYINLLRSTVGAALTLVCC
jgi:hypothetical protein